MYYIYHIPGVKIGCSKTPAERVAKQGYTQFDVLEIHSDIHEVSNREKELQKEYGYAVDKAYYYETVSRASLGGLAGGPAKALLTEEQKQEIRNKFVPYKYSYRTLAKEYGVSKGCIQNALTSL